ncbi:hypothetical protein CPB86DRAFT_809931 [Serendipita vermifera]|nr:hypothetical protein CPB86DRAFT_809931 [Serendipita vermifera]
MKGVTVDDMLFFPTSDDLFWEHMHAHKRYALSQEQYEKEWSAWLRIYLFGDKDSVTKTSEPRLTGDPSLSLSSTFQSANTMAAVPPVFIESKPHDSHQCSICFKEYPRVAGAEGCENRHLQIKPYVCTRRCGNKNWYVAKYLTIIYYWVTDRDETVLEHLQRPRNGTDTTARQSQRRSAVNRGKSSTCHVAGLLC